MTAEEKRERHRDYMREYMRGNTDQRIKATARSQIWYRKHREEAKAKFRVARAALSAEEKRRLNHERYLRYRDQWLIRSRVWYAMLTPEEYEIQAAKKLEQQRKRRARVRRNGTR
jgi:hypothetical protein